MGKRSSQHEKDTNPQHQIATGIGREINLADEEEGGGDDCADSNDYEAWRCTDAFPFPTGLVIVGRRWQG